jgi:3-polyprenyl-4-hydroxybenzoate decarboxylase
VVKDAPFWRTPARGRQGRSRQIPAPVWHRKDGGPFIGSGSIVIMRDPDGLDQRLDLPRAGARPNKVTVQFDHAGRHGAIIAKKYWDRASRARSRWSTARTRAVHRRL